MSRTPRSVIWIARGAIVAIAAYLCVLIHLDMIDHDGPINLYGRLAWACIFCVMVMVIAGAACALVGAACDE